MRGRKSQLGDTREAPNGYHYTRTENGWELTGRIVAAQAMLRELRPDERIRYRDGDRSNNSLDNIEIYIVKERSKAKRKALLESKIESLQAELEDLTIKR